MTLIKTHPVSRRQTLALVSACSVAFFMFGLTSAIVGPTVYDLALALGVSVAAVGLLRSARQIGQFIGFLSLGRAADTTDLRLLALWGGLTMAAGLLLVTYVNFTVAFCAVVIWGLGHSTYNLAPNVVIGRVFQERAPGVMTSLHGVYGIGAVSGPWMAEVMRPHGVQTIYAVSAAMTALAACLYWVATKGLKGNEPAPKTAGGEAAKPIPFRVILPFVLGVLLFSGANFTASDWLHFYTDKVVGAGSIIATIITSAFWLAMTGGRFVLGYVTAKLGERFVLRLAAISSVVGAALLTMPTFSLGVILCGSALLGLGLAPVYPILIASAANLFPDSRGKVTGYLAAAGAFGAIVLPVLQGWLSSVNSQGLLVVLLAALAMGASIWSIPLKTKAKGE